MAKEIRPTNQIVAVVTERKCISMMDKLKIADPRHYAQLHAKGEESENGIKINSLIQIILQDYSNGKGANNVKVTFNLEPEQIQFIFSRINACVQEFEFQSDKIFGNPDAEGLAQAQQLRITRKVMNDRGEVNRSPWNFYISNGRGVKVTNRNGGSYMKGGSFRKESTAFIQLTDADMFKLFKRVDAFISQWEAYAGNQVIAKGIELFEQSQKEARRNSYGNAQYGQPTYGQAQYGQEQQYAQAVGYAGSYGQTQ